MGDKCNYIISLYGRKVSEPLTKGDSIGSLYAIDKEEVSFFMGLEKEYTTSGSRAWRAPIPVSWRSLLSVVKGDGLEVPSGSSTCFLNFLLTMGLEPAR